MPARLRQCSRFFLRSFFVSYLPRQTESRRRPSDFAKIVKTPLLSGKEVRDEKKLTKKVLLLRGLLRVYWWLNFVLQKSPRYFVFQGMRRNKFVN